MLMTCAKPMKRLLPLKSVGLNCIRSFVLKGCSRIVVSLIKFIFTLRFLCTLILLHRENKRLFWSLKRDSRTSVIIGLLPFSVPFLRYQNLSFMSILTVILKSKLYSSQHCFTKTRSSSTTLATFLDTVTSTACFVGDYESINFDVTSVSIWYYIPRF
jgi:hypothetical protein